MSGFMDGFELWKPSKKRGSITITKNGLFIPVNVSHLLSSEYCEFGWGGDKSFALSIGSDLQIVRQSGCRSLKIASKPLIHFIYSKLETSFGVRISLPCTIINDTIVFGVF